MGGPTLRGRGDGAGADVGGVLPEAVEARDEKRGGLAGPRPRHGHHVPSLREGGGQDRPG